MLVNFLKDTIIPLSITPLGLYSENAKYLLIGTYLQESLNGKYSKQVNGPALGIYQMEPNTHKDIWENYLVYRGKYTRTIKQMLPLDQHSTIPNDNHLIYNLIYATQLARIHYYRVKEPIPDYSNIEELANYWKKYYNTDKGRGEPYEFIEKFERYGITNNK